MRSHKLITRENLIQWGEEVGIEFKTLKVVQSEVFLEHRNKCKYLYFVTKGFVRFYYLDIEGKEKTHLFAPEGSMITSPDSFFNEETNILNFQALEESEFICITKEQISIMTSKISAANDAMQQLYLDYLVVFSRKIMSIYTESAEYRYLKLLEESPDIFQRAKLSHIASYLGIAQQSLSRIRKSLIR